VRRPPPVDSLATEITSDRAPVVRRFIAMEIQVSHTPLLSRAGVAAAVLALVAALPAGAQMPTTDSIPLPEHPRPDFHRAGWVNLNGRWRFRTDAADAGARAGWANAPLGGDRTILVPFSWGSPASGISDTADVAWYERAITVPAGWNGKRVFLVVGASDWRTTVWLDGKKLGEHQGGYTPFSMELPASAVGRAARLTFRVDDTPHDFKLEGKQGYGRARGPWQTVYLEARGATPLASIHFTPASTLDRVTVDARLLEPAPRATTLSVTFTNRDGQPTVTRPVARGATTVRFDVPLPNAHRWSLDDPFLHEATVSLGTGPAADRVDTYFGMRTISVVDLPGSTHRYVAINGRPVYLQLALDQAYHPDGYYTFPSDAFTRDEILRARQIGLNGLREHIKVETPRKLYWADRLGVLIMADVPNWWGDPDSLSFAEHDVTQREMIDRDYNHPAVFSWILFNETWGLLDHAKGKHDVYSRATQTKVASEYRLARTLDSTRLIEDNSVCCDRGHTETDINSWHAYLAGYEWEKLLGTYSDSTRPGSGWNFEDGWTQARQPMINSEFGNVWGYAGSTGDVDWSWDYHMAVDAFRRHPALAGWLYTEHHDVINEWNGYWRFDRTNKETGLGALVDGMSLRDLHAPFYIATGPELANAAKPGESVQVPLWASFLSDRPAGDSLVLRAELKGWNSLGEERTYSTMTRMVPYRAWMSEALAPLPVTMPNEPAVAVLGLRLEDRAGAVLARNFTTYVVQGDASETMTLAGGRRARVARVGAGAYTASQWSQKSWQVLGGLKADGAGSGFFEYTFAWPKGLAPNDVDGASFVVEASAKQLFGKDRDSLAKDEGDYMRGQGLHDPSRNPNAYPMTDATPFPSAVTVRVNGELAGTAELSDDPADHRGILSWFSQTRDKHLHEAGSYGQLVRVTVPPAALASAARTGNLVVRLEVPESLPGGLAIYGAKFGRYPVDPSIVFVLKQTTAAR
jgi:Glycosyl hydrolases family 2, sugar binding domain/Glycosyl hydrolases family 2, TIM barrel domain/Glycosyl hydrolases family 2